MQYCVQGLGKTVQMLALIVSAPPTPEDAVDALENAERSTRNAEAALKNLPMAAAKTPGAGRKAGSGSGVPSRNHLPHPIVYQWPHTSMHA